MGAYQIDDHRSKEDLACSATDESGDERQWPPVPEHERRFLA